MRRDGCPRVLGAARWRRRGATVLLAACWRSGGDSAAGDGCPGCFGVTRCRRRGATALPVARSRSGGNGAARRLSPRLAGGAVATARRNVCLGCSTACSARCRRRGARALPAACSRSGGDGAARRLSRRPWRGATRRLWRSATEGGGCPGGFGAAQLRRRGGVAAVLACSLRGGFGAARRLSVRLWRGAMTTGRRDSYPRGLRAARRRRRSATAVPACWRRGGFGAVRRLFSLTERGATSTARRDGRPRGLRKTPRRALYAAGGARRVGRLRGCLLFARVSLICDVYTIKTNMNEIDQF